MANGRELLMANSAAAWGGAKKPTARNYLKYGCIAMWDAIENVGLDQPHSNSTTVWYDLAGGMDITWRGSAFADDYAKWTDNSMWFANLPNADMGFWRNDISQSLVNAINSAEMTVEFGIDTRGSMIYNRTIVQVSGSGFNTFFVWGSRYSIHSNYSLGKGTINTVNTLSRYSIKANGFTDDSTTVDDMNPSTTYVGCTPDLNVSYNTSTNKAIYVATRMTDQMRGHLHFLRIYDHALTADETAATLAIDRVRYGF